MIRSLAIRNLMHGKVRSLVAIGGVCLAVTLLFMQLGFYASVSLTANLVYDALDFDLLLTAPHYVALAQAGKFPRTRLHQALSHPDVKQAMPLYVHRHVWRNPITRLRRAVVVLGIHPSDPIARVAEIRQQCPKLAQPYTMLIDRMSRRELGPLDIGTVVDVGLFQVTIVGQFTIGPGFESGLIFVSDQTYAKLLFLPTLENVNLGLLKLRPEANLNQVAEELRQMLPSDVRVLTRAEMAEKEREYWVTSTSTGIIFGTGVIVAVLFGIVITYQVLTLEVSHRLSEYATLKAMGFSDWTLARVVLVQAALFALVSYVPGYLFALVIYGISHGVTGLPISMTTERSLAVFFINLLLCSLSGLFALRILRKADPVDLFP